MKKRFLIPLVVTAIPVMFLGVGGIAIVTTKLLVPAHAETPEQVKQRLQDYRQHDLDTERYVEEKKRREYEETWKSYGATKVNRKTWKQEKDGSWVTQAKFSVPFPADEAPTDRVRFGDNLADIAQRNNLTIHQLLELNPDLRAARLVLGTSIRVGHGGSRRVLGLRPLGSAGLSWPDPADFWQGEQKIAVTCRSLMVNVLRSRSWDGWFRPKPGTPTEQLIIDRCSVPPPGTPPPPKAGEEEAWTRKWCSIGWRNYGEVHIDRCMNLIDKRMH